jgi:hypothetical protein
MKYRVFGNKKKTAYHEINPETGKTICKAENNLQLGVSRDYEIIPENRRACQLCYPPAPPEFLEAEGEKVVLFQKVPSIRGSVC